MSDKWDKPLDKLLATLDGLNEDVLKGVDNIPGVVDEIKDRTPVDTGEARDSFSVGRLPNGRWGIGTSDDSGKIIALEFGHSTQAPQGMIVLGGKQYKNIAQKILDKKLDD